MRIGIGERAKKYSVYDTEDCRVRANAKGKSQNSDGGKTHTLAKHSCAVAQILYQFIENPGAARFPAFLLHALDAAKLYARLAHRFSAGQSAAHQILCTHLHVEPQLRVHLAFHAGTIEYCLRPSTEPAPEVHTSSSVMSQIPTMMRAIIRISAPLSGPRSLLDVPADRRPPAPRVGGS